MDLPIEINIKIEELLSGYKLVELKEVANKLMDNYKNQSGKGNTLIDDLLMSKIYVAFRMPATFKATFEALSYSLSLFKEDIKSVIDIGSGSGAASIAANLLLGNIPTTCLEKDNNMIEIAKKISPFDHFIYQNFDIAKDEIVGQKDLVIESYMLNELKEADLESAIEKMWFSAAKMLILVEPGTPKGYQILLKARDIILKNKGYIIAPCPHMDKCPMLEDDWCHFSTRVQRSKMHRLLKEGEAPFEDEKYAYMAFSKAENVRATSRVLRHPVIKKNSVSLHLCTKNGLEDIENYKSEKEKYKKARKIKVGDDFDL